MSAAWTERDEQRVRYARLAEQRGWAVSRARSCPSIVLRNGHRRVNCMCDSWQLDFHVWDHAHMWRIPENHQHVLTLEPYLFADSGESGNETDYSGVHALAAEVSPLGLAVEISADSPWNPGRTTLLIITRSAAADADAVSAFGNGS